MKETYRIPVPPEIACDGDLVASRNSTEILNVLGFCTSAPQAEQKELDTKTQVLDAINSLLSTSDDEDPMYRTLIPLPMGWDEVNLRFEAM